MLISQKLKLIFMYLFIKTLLSPKPFSLTLSHSHSHKPFSLLSIFGATRSASDPSPTKTHSAKPIKPLDILFKQALGIYPKPHISDDENGGEGERNTVKRGLRDLERELMSLRPKGIENRPKALFTNRVRRDGERFHFKEISDDMKLFVSVLHKQGYLNESNFLEKNGIVGGDNDGLDFSCFDNSFARGFIKFAAEKFGKDKQEIAKWLSGSDLKTVSLFGCPSLSKKSIFAAKRLRKFFQIEENTVCSKCALNQSCKFVNQNVWKTDTKKLVLIDALNVLIPYALESAPPRLLVTDEINASVSRLLNDVVKLTQTTSQSCST